MQTANSPSTPSAPKRTLSADELARAQDHFAEHGYAVFPGVISKDRLAELHGRLQAEFERWRGDGRLFEGGGNLTGHLNCFPGRRARFAYTELEDQGVVDAILHMRPGRPNDVRATMNYNLPGSVAQHYHIDGLYVDDFVICNVAVVDTASRHAMASVAGVQ